MNTRKMTFVELQYRFQAALETRNTRLFLGEPHEVETDKLNKLRAEFRRRESGRKRLGRWERRYGVNSINTSTH